MSLHLLHLANFNSTNIGNGALIQGTERVISEDFGRPVRWARAAWDDYTFGIRKFDREFVRLVNSHDGLVIGGAVAINGRHYLSETGMRVDLPLELWRDIEKPVIFHGISYRHWPGQPFHHADRLRSLVDLVLSSPRMVLGVRNDGTREWLARLLGLENIQGRFELVPDPAMYVPPEAPASYPELRGDRPNVMLSFNDEDAEFRYAVPGSRERVIRALADAVQQLAAEQVVNVVLVPHYFDDYRMLGDFVNACTPRFAHQHLVSTGLLKVDQAGYFYGRYARASMAISMRVHSMSPSIGLGIPVVPVVTQDRMWDYLRDAGLADIGLDAFSPDLAARLFEASRAALAHPASLQDRVRAASAALRLRMRDFNRRCAELFP